MILRFREATTAVGVAEDEPVIESVAFFAQLPEGFSPIHFHDEYDLDAVLDDGDRLLESVLSDLQALEDHSVRGDGGVDHEAGLDLLLQLVERGVTFEDLPLSKDRFPPAVTVARHAGAEGVDLYLQNLGKLNGWIGDLGESEGDVIHALCDGEVPADLFDPNDNLEDECPEEAAGLSVSLPFSRSAPISGSSLLSDLLTDRSEERSEQAKKYTTAEILDNYIAMGYAFDRKSRNPAHANELSLILSNASADGLRKAYQEHGGKDVLKHMRAETTKALKQFLDLGGRLDPHFRTLGGSNDLMCVFHHTGVEGWNVLREETDLKLNPGIRNKFWESELTTLRASIVKNHRNIETTVRGEKQRMIVEYPTPAEARQVKIVERQYNQMAEEQAQARRARVAASAQHNAPIAAK